MFEQILAHIRHDDSDTLPVAVAVDQWLDALAPPIGVNVVADWAPAVAVARNYFVFAEAPDSVAAIDCSDAVVVDG